MEASEDHVLLVAGLVRDAAAMNEAALGLDFDEARFLARLIATGADEAGFVDLALAAAHLTVVLGPAGAVPASGYGTGMLRVADALGALGFEPL